MEQVAKEGDEWGRREREGRNGDTSSVSLVYNVYSSISLVRSNNLNATAGFARRVVVPYNTNDIHLLMRGDPPGKSTKLNTIQISPRSSCVLRADSGFTQRGGEGCGLWRRNDGNSWCVGGIGPENLTGGSRQAGARTTFGLSLRCVQYMHRGTPSRSKKRTGLRRKDPGLGINRR